MRSNHRNGIALVTALALAVAPVHGHSQQQGATSARSPAAPTQSPFASQLDTLVESLRKDVGARGVAVALIENGKVTTVRTYGYADLERRIPVTPQTTFNAASVTKAATAWGIMKLVDEGKVKLDDPVFSHIKRWKLPPSKWPAIRQAKSNTPGFVNCQTISPVLPGGTCVM